VIHHRRSEQGLPQPQRSSQPQGLRERRGLIYVRAGPFMDAGREHAAAAPAWRATSAPRALRKPRALMPCRVEPRRRRRISERDHHQLRGQDAQGAVRKGLKHPRAARAAGPNRLSSCEEGFCASCAAKRITGKIVLAKNDSYTPDDLATTEPDLQGHCFGPEVRSPTTGCEPSLRPLPATPRGAILTLIAASPTAWAHNHGRRSPQTDGQTP